MSDEEAGGGMEGVEPGDIAVQDSAVLEQIKQEGQDNAAVAPPAPAGQR